MRFFGLKTCDTCRKALKNLAAAGYDPQVIDVRADGISAADLQTIIATFGIVTPLIGMIAAFISAAVAVKWMVGYLSGHTLAVFGWYRLGLTVVAGGLILSATV
ncbi:MAG: hypothetical protein NWP79_03730 [Paracoccaceae bacterium]|nr:hypothetical protein [Paracoccaceae bacterium]